MAQFYTKERSVTGASPKIYDDSQRILTEAENIIESMRAVSSIEEQQNATLINNLRAHRQREKELNTRNHQMLMDNMQQVAEAQQRKDQIALDNKNLKRKEDIAQEQRTMETLATLSQVAGKAAGALVEQGLAKAEEQMKVDLDNQHKIQQRVPQAKDGTGLALNSQLAIDDQVEMAELTTASMAERAGKEMNFVARLFVRPDRLERRAVQLQASALATRVESGLLEDIIRQEPTRTISYVFNGELKEVPLSDMLEGKIQSSEELNRFYTALNDKEFSGLKEGRDPALFLKADEQTRNYINTRALQYGDKLTRNAIERFNTVKIQSVLLGDSPEQVAKNAVQYITESGMNPTVGHGNALTNITNSILPSTKSPVAFYEAIGELEFGHMPDVKIKDTPFGKKLEREALRLEQQKSADYLREQESIGTEAGNKLFKASFGDNQLFDAVEYNRSYNAVREKEKNGTLTFEAARKAELVLDSKYDAYSDSKLTKELITDLSEQQELSQPVLDSAFQAGHINRETYDSETGKLKALDTVKLPNGLRYSQKTIRSQALAIATDKVGRVNVTGQPKHFSAQAAADLAADMYIQKFNTYAEEFTPDVAAKKAWADVQGEMLREEGMFFIDSSDDTRGAIYSRLSTGDHTGAMRVPTRSNNTANQVGLTLRGDGAGLLDVKEWTELDSSMPSYAAQINSGKPVKLTAFDQEVFDAAGISAYEGLNRRFKVLGIDAEAKEGSFDILRKNVSEISPELKRVINSPKTWNKLSSVTDRSPNLLPARMGNQSLGFGNASSIARKFGHPNPELIGALWSVQTDEGRTQPNLTPAQQISQIIENNPKYSMFIPYADIASTAPQVAVVMRKYGDSHSNFSGASKSISRLQTVALRQEVTGGPIRGLTHNDYRELSRAISGEAKLETDDVYMVAASILNRVADPRYGNSIAEVFEAPDQYEAFSKGSYKYDSEIAADLSSPEGQKKLAQALTLLEGRTDFKGQSQLKNRGEGDLMAHPLGNFYHYAGQTGFGPYTGEVPTHYQQYLR